MTTNRPEFLNPPLIEVACGILFKPLSAFVTPYMGLLWREFKSDYPLCREVAPLAPVIESFDDSKPAFRAELTDIPPMPRSWFIGHNEHAIIQVQRDRFLHNWKKVSPDDQYPRFHQVIDAFRNRLSTFKGFLAKHQLGSLQPLQYEITYVNHIPADTWQSPVQLGRVLPDFAWRNTPERFLPAAEAVNWRSIFVLPNQVGRLHVSVRTGTRQSDYSPVLLLDLTARGMPSDSSPDTMWSWFDLAHDWIVRAFADLTADDIQRTAWRRTQ
ncbi:MAG: TIGR04255 family protein [Planctomycetota bacterium]